MRTNVLEYDIHMEEREERGGLKCVFILNKESFKKQQP